MKDERPVVSAATIRAESAWLRRLAGALVGDGADDAVQETWLAGLAHPPGEAGPLGGWLRVVLRNVVRKRARSEGRRRAREAAAPGAETPSPEELAVRAEAQRLVADLVLALDEPYRGTVLLCYYEGLAPSEVAHRLGVPAGTVRWRLSRALATLRAELDRRYTAKSWRPLLAPLGLAGPRKGTKGTMMMNATITTVAVAGAATLALVGGGLALQARDAAPGAAPPATAPAAVTAPPHRRAGPRLQLPRLTPPPASTVAAIPLPAAKPPFDDAAVKLAVRDRLQEVKQRVSDCLRRWASVDPSLAGGVRLNLGVDAMGLTDVWLEDRARAPSESLACLSEAVYQTDWSGVTTTAFRTYVVIRYERTDGGPPPEDRAVSPARSGG